MGPPSSSQATALVLERPRRLVPQALPIPSVGPADAVLRVEACGLCGTDHEQFTGVLPAGFAFVPGHETIGVVEAIGDEAAARWRVREGDRVAVEVFQTCRVCPACRSGEYRRCERHGLRDMYGFVPVDKAPGLWGGYATHQYLSPDTIVHRVPAGLDPVVATLFNPLGAGIRWGLTVPGTRADDVVAVLGPGIRGLSVLIAAKQAGAGFVMVTGYGPRDASRLQIAAGLGADLVIDVATADPAAALKEATGGLADVVVDVTAKAPAALAQAIAVARPGATVVLAGTRGSAETPNFWPDLIVYKELRLLGALGVDSAAYEAALELLAAGGGELAGLPRRIEGFAGMEALLGAMAGEGDEAPPVHAVLVP